ncbi:MAG: histidine phosphatase family protein [Bacteroidaceae bacterium]|nr:histidine phosphatase family protein [Bacteroidaceae bacterium]
MKRRFFSLVLTAGFAVAMSADVIPVDQINESNINKFGGLMYEYVAPDVKYTPAPKGFKPFYLSHYGRHGSRYMLNASQYERPYTILKDASDKGVLTEFGRTVLDRVEVMKNDAAGRLGDLTPKGMRQHKGITRRMMENYPGLFKNGEVTARSTGSHRVIVSMLSGLSEIYREYPDLKITYDAGDHDVAYLNQEDNAVSASKNSSAKSQAVNEFNQRHTRPDRLMTVLFTDTAFIRHYEMKSTSRPFPGMGSGQTTVRVMDASATLYNDLYDMAANMQSHDLGIDLNDVFTYQEWYDSFLMNNLYWYSVSAFSPLTGDIVPYGRCALLQDFIDRADAAIGGNGITLDLRYGHDTQLIPFVCLMELNDFAWSVSDLERVADKWVLYDLVHMGSNVQWIFYRDKSGQVLVKFLMNEEEAVIPIPCYTDSKGVSHPHYYAWEDVKKFYLSKIDYFNEFKAAQSAGK